MQNLDTPSKIVCVGRNYADHAKELGNAIPDTPILFIKPPSSLRALADGIVMPQGLGESHFETELCVRIGTPLKNATREQAVLAIDGVTLGLDLTLRDLQNTLKANGHPWERAKAFDGACLLGEWLSPAMVDLAQAEFELSINGIQRQYGNTAQMIFGVVGLVAHISQSFSLCVGDVVMTGTPAGVAALQVGDQLRMRLHTQLGAVDWQTEVLG